MSAKAFHPVNPHLFAQVALASYSGREPDPSATHGASRPRLVVTAFVSVRRRQPYLLWM